MVTQLAMETDARCHTARPRTNSSERQAGLCCQQSGRPTSSTSVQVVSSVCDLPVVQVLSLHLMRPFGVAAQDFHSKSLPDVLCSFAMPIAPVRGARCTQAGRPGGVVAPQWCSGRGDFCDAHCWSQRCRLHRGPVCSISGCGAVPTPSCVVGTCEAHCIQPQCSPPPHPLPFASRHTNRSLVICRTRSCSERMHLECSTRHCILHCSSRRCQFFAHPNGQGGKPINDGPRDLRTVFPSRDTHCATFVVA